MAWDKSGNERIQFVATFIRETGKAMLVTDTGDESDSVWLAKSQIEWEILTDGEVDITAPLWLLREKGLR
jgi:hypothetical protein